MSVPYPVLRRRNLQLVKHVSVRDVVLKGKKARGVNYSIGRREKRADARCEVILCAGAIGSPALLQRSGIDPAKLLQATGIDVVHELPSVGENLQDHLEVYFQYRCKQPITLNSKLD